MQDERTGRTDGLAGAAGLGILTFLALAVPVVLALLSLISLPGVALTGSGCADQSSRECGDAVTWATLGAFAQGGLWIVALVAVSILGQRGVGRGPRAIVAGATAVVSVVVMIVVTRLAG